MSYKFDFAFLADRWPDFVAGAWLTVQLTVASIALGFVVGTVCALARVYGGPILRRLVGIYVETIRNTPLLIQIFLVYFGLSSLGLKLSAEVSAIVALTVNMGAYTTEIMRAGIQSIQRTQLEAADCLGLTKLQTILHVVLLPAMERVYPGALQPVRAADAGLVHHLADLGRGADRDREPRAVGHVTAASRST
jgi:polar amino acid transport system permease protein